MLHCGRSFSKNCFFLAHIQAAMVYCRWASLPLTSSSWILNTWGDVYMLISCTSQIHSFISLCFSMSSSPPPRLCSCSGLISEDKHLNPGPASQAAEMHNHVQSFCYETETTLFPISFLAVSHCLCLVYEVCSILWASTVIRWPSAHSSRSPAKSSRHEHTTKTKQQKA